MNTFLLRTATLASLLLAALAPAAAADGDLLPGFGTDAEFPGMVSTPVPTPRTEVLMYYRWMVCPTAAWR